MSEQKKITAEEIKSRFDEANTHLSFEAWEAYCENMAYNDPQVDEAEECYAGEFRNATEFAEHFADETGLLAEMPDNLRFYFDFEAYGRDMLMGGDVWQENGFWFWNR